MTSTSPTSLESVAAPSNPPKVGWADQVLARPLRCTLLLAVVCALLLQIWRPLYHLTDDNLTAYLPVFVEFSHRLWSGQNPMINESLFEGGYNFMRDPSVFGLLSPYMLLCTPLGLTHWAYLVPDIIASLNLLTIAGAFCWSALQLRESMKLNVSNGVIVLLSLSYAFSPYNLVVNPSWLGFINPQAAAPVVLAGLFEPRLRRAAVMIMGGMLFALFGGHLHPFLYLCVFAGGLAAIVSWHERSFQPLQRLAAGAFLTALVASPILLATLFGFSSSTRQASLPPQNVLLSRLSPFELICSLVLGPVATPLVPDMQVHSADRTFASAIAFSLANVPLFWALIWKRRWLRLELGLIAISGVVMLFIIRPIWLQLLINHVPLFRSLRWPFREVANLNFIIHTLALLNLAQVSERARRLSFAIGGAMLSLIGFGAPPTFNPMHIDRELVISGRAEAFWRDLNQRLGGRPHIIVSGSMYYCYGKAMQFVPFSFLGAYNYASLFGFVNHSGYSTTQTGTLGQTETAPYHLGGIYYAYDAEEIWRAHPELTYVSLVNLKPACFRVRHGAQEFRFVYDQRSGQLTELPGPFAKEEKAAAKPAAPETP